jgi:ATP phosphoribosyltransferase regulatory subunit HisZ
MDDVAIEAMSLTDGADIHDIAGVVAIYRAMIRDGLDAGELERELRAYVARKRQIGRLRARVGNEPQKLLP